MVKRIIKDDGEEHKSKPIVITELET